MEACELRWNEGILEYRTLMLWERETPTGGDLLYIDWRKRYTEWKPVPRTEGDQ